MLRGADPGTASSPTLLPRAVVASKTPNAHSRLISTAMVISPAWTALDSRHVMDLYHRGAGKYSFRRSGGAGLHVVPTVEELARGGPVAPQAFGIPSRSLSFGTSNP